MVILNLGCGSKTSDYSEVVNIDWSISLIIKKSFLLRIFLSKLISKGRYKKIQNLPNNIIIHDLRKGIPCRSNSVDAVYHSHVLEHIDRSKVKEFLYEVYRVLKPNGIHRIVVPDLYFLCKSYIDNYHKCTIDNKVFSTHDNYVGAILEQSVRKEAYGSSKQNILRRRIENILLGDARQRGETHQWMYDRVNLSNILEEIGFKEIQVKSYLSSDILDWQKYGLDTDNKDKEYKIGSLYIESRK